MARVARSSIFAFVLAAVVLSGVGCRASQDPAAVSRLVDGQTTATATQTASPSAVATQAPQPAQPRIESLDATQAKALEAELKAIERELDQLDLPSDSDFSGIESQLP